jgi:hypothetical protein
MIAVSIPEIIVDGGCPNFPARLSQFGQYPAEQGYQVCISETDTARARCRGFRRFSDDVATRREDHRSLRLDPAAFGCYLRPPNTRSIASIIGTLKFFSS